MQIHIDASKIVKISELLCSESCIMTCLHILGLEYRYVLLENWGLLYEADTLLPGRKLSKIDLKPIYGFRTEEEIVSIGDLAKQVKLHRILLVSVLASRLSFFPKYRLNFESVGFTHQVIVYDYDEKANRFALVDPIAEYIGTVSAEELQAASIVEQKFRIWKMDFPGQQPELSAAQIFQKVTSINYVDIRRTNKAFQLLRERLSQLPKLDAKERDAWIYRHNLTLNAILKVRQNIWAWFCSLHFMTEQQIAAGKSMMNVVVKHWSAINFRIAKLKNNPMDLQLLETIVQKLEGVEQAEAGLLALMYQWGKNQQHV